MKNGIMPLSVIWRKHMERPTENYWEARFGHLKEELSINLEKEEIGDVG
jgi:hypothetical protein